MRLGIVPYSNCVPLVHGISCEIYKVPPSELTQKAKPDDIIMAPIVASFMEPGWHLLEGVGIGSFGAVDTVKLFLNKKEITPQNIKKIYLDTDSLTSINLLKILLQKSYGRDLSEIDFTASPSESDGALLIGDKTWEQNPNRPFLDLGQAWTDATHLPFVFACWMTRSPEVGREWKTRLVEQAKQNLSRLETISEDPKLLKYWKQLCYELGTPQKKAIQLFQDYWIALNNKPRIPSLWL